MQPTIHQFKVRDLSGKTQHLSDFSGKVLLIVNTASECGFTPQYQSLESLYQEFKKEGFEVLAFPSNDFRGQEPLEGEEIQQFCSLNYRTTFPVFDKIHVRGQDAHPLYKFLYNRQKNGSVGMPPFWNFHKYLIDRQGRVVDYFFTFTSPTAKRVKRTIRALL